MRRRKIIITTIVFGIIALNSVSSQVYGASSPSPATAGDKVTDLKQKAYVRIDRRLQDLNKLLKTVTTTTILNDNQRDELQKEVEVAIESLNKLRNKIEAGTDYETLKTDRDNIVTAHRIYAVKLPKFKIIIAAYRLENIISETNRLNGKIQKKLDEAKAAGKDISALQEQFTQAKNKIESTKTDVEKARESVNSVVPSGYPGNKTVMQSAKTKLQTSHTDIKAAFTEIAKVYAAL